MANVINALGTKAPRVEVFPRPKVMLRAPLTTDVSYKRGQLWIYEDAAGTDDIYILSSKRNGSANWLNMGGGGGSFDSLTVTGAATIGTALTLSAGNLTVSALTAGTVRSSAAGVFSVLADGNDGTVLVGTTGGAAAWATLTAGAGINITEAAGAITITNPGATGTTMTASDANVVAPDGAGNTDVIGYDTNITTDGAVANTLKVRLADNIVSVGSITATSDLSMSTGTCTIASDANAAQAIYLHANGGVNETIDLHVSLGTAADSIALESTVGGLLFSSGLASANAVNITASDAAGGVDVDFGTGGMSIIGANGVFDVQTGTANITIGADATDHDIEIGDAAGVNAMALISGTGHTAITSTGNITLDAAGVVELNSSADTISIGNDGVAQNMNFGTGAAARVVTIGNTSAASQVVIDCGTAGVNVGTSATAHTSTFGATNTTSATTVQSGTGAMTVTAGGVLDVNVTDALTMDSTAGTLSFGAGADNFDVNLATGGTRTTIIGNANTTSSVVLNVGTGNLDLGVSATSHTTRVGSTSGTSATTIQAGTGATTVTAGGILDINATDALTMDSSGGTMSFGNDAVAQNMNFGTGGAQRTITIGNATGTTGVVVNAGTGVSSFAANATEHNTTVGSITTASTTTIQAGTGGLILAAAGDVDIQPATGTAAANSITLNGKVTVATLTGQTTASGAQETFTITNDQITAASGLIVNVGNIGTNDARISKEQVKTAAGSVEIKTQNNGGAALNGDVIISIIVLS